MGMKVKLLGAGALLAAITAASLTWPGRSAPVVVPADGADASAPVASARASDAAFVPSMRGTQPDGALRAGDKLVVDAELRHMFDYYLAALGEKDLPAIRAQVEAELQRRLPPAAAAEARRLLAQYLAYKHALVGAERELKPQANPAAAARARLQAMQQLRAVYFSPEENAGLFGDSDADDRDAVARLDIAYDKSLTDAQRKERYTALDNKLTPAQRADREAPTRIVRLEENIKQARANGADDKEVYRLRSAALSPEAASRLAQVDQETADWQRRIADYQAERGRLQAQQASDAAMQQLRDARFSTIEQKRLGAYE